MNRSFSQKSAPNYHFTIKNASDLLADIDIWERAHEGVFEKGHFHSYYEILVFKKGGGMHQMGQEIYPVEDCSIHVLTSNTFHELKRTRATDGFEIIFSDVFLNQLQNFDTRTNYLKYFSQSRVINFTAAEFSNFQVYFDELARYKRNSSIFYNLVSLIILKIISASADDRKTPLHATFEKSLLALLNAHYKERPGLDFYASRLHMSLNSFRRHCASAFGKSITELPNEKILQEIRFLLSNTEMPIKEISADFNFADESHFTRFFKRHISVLPSEYRRTFLG